MRGAKQKEMLEISDLRRRVRSVCPFNPLWGDTLAIFGGFKILNFNFFFFFFFFLGGGGGR